MIIQLTEKERDAVQSVIDYFLYIFRVYNKENDEYDNFENILESCKGEFIRELHSARRKMETP